MDSRSLTEISSVKNAFYRKGCKLEKLKSRMFFQVIDVRKQVEHIDLAEFILNSNMCGVALRKLN